MGWHGHRTDDDLGRQIDNQFVARRSLDQLNSASTSAAGSTMGKMPFLKQLLKKISAKTRQ
jgi:hypothetical protein